MGAGPAGSTTARYCARKDIDVLMIDRRKEIGSPVQCGELLPEIREMYSIFPDTAGLEELFVFDSESVAGRNHSLELISPGGKTYRIDFASVSLDRRAFDKHLVKLAEEAGARLSTEASLLSIENGVARTSLGDVRAKVIVGADGPNSRTAREAGLRLSSRRYPAISCRGQGQFDPCVKMYFGAMAPGGYAWIIPKDRGANIGLGFSSRYSKDRPSEALERFASSIGASVSDRTLGFVPMSGPVKSTVSGNTLLVGDSAGMVMPSNGGGIPTAMIAGREAGTVIREHLGGRGSLADYERRWRSLMGTPLRNSRRTSRLADLAFTNGSFLGLSMSILGKRGLDRAVRCKRLFL